MGDQRVPAPGPPHGQRGAALPLLAARGLAAGGGFGAGGTASTLAACRAFLCSHRRGVSHETNVTDREIVPPGPAFTGAELTILQSMRARVEALEAQVAATRAVLARRLMQAPDALGVAAIVVHDDRLERERPVVEVPAHDHAARDVTGPERDPAQRAEQADQVLVDKKRCYTPHP